MHISSSHRSKRHMVGLQLASTTRRASGGMRHWFNTLCIKMYLRTNAKYLSRLLQACHSALCTISNLDDVVLNKYGVTVVVENHKLCVRMRRLSWEGSCISWLSSLHIDNRVIDDG